MDTMTMPKGMAELLKGTTGTVETQQEPLTTETPSEIISKTATETKAEPLTTETKAKTTETPVETPAVTEKETETPAPAEEKPWFSQETTPDATTPAEAKINPSDLLSKKAQLMDRVMENPALKYVVEGMLAGKQPEDLLKEFQTVDYNSMPSEDVAKLYGKMKKWTDEQIEEEVGALNGMRPSEKEERMERWINKLNDDQAGKLSKAAGGYKEQMVKQSQAAAEKEQFIQKRFTEDIQKEKQFLVGKDFFGVKFNEEDANDFEKFVTTEFDFIREDGTYDIPRMRNFWLGAKKIQVVQKTNYGNGKSEGTHETLKVVHRPSESGAAPTRVPIAKKPMTNAEGALEAAKKAFGGR